MSGKQLLAGFILLAAFLVCHQPVQAQSTPVLFGEANRAFWNEKYDTAVVKFRRFLDENPEHSLRWDAHFGLARALNKLNRLEASLRHYRLVRENHPSRALRGDALFAESEIAVARNQAQRARRLIREFLKRHPDHALAPTARKQLTLLRPSEPETPPDATASRNEETTSDTPGTTIEPNGGAETSDSPPTPSGSPGASGSEVKGNAARTDAGSDTRPTPDRVFPDELASSPDTDARTGSEGDGPEQPRGESNGEPGDPDLRRRLENLEDRVERQEETLSDLRSTVRRFKTRNELLKKEKDRLKRQRDQLRRRLSRLRESPGEATSETGSEPPQSGSDASPPEEQAASDAGGDSPVIPDEVTAADRHDTAGTVPDSLTEAQLRRRIERHHQRNDFARARRLQKHLLDRFPTAENYYRAARLLRSTDREPERVLRNLQSAIAASDTVPVEYVLLKAQVYLENDRLREFDRLVENRGSRIKDTGKPAQKSRFHYLLGRRSLRANEDDTGFFEFMESIRSAPDSRWARLSRRVVKAEL